MTLRDRLARIVLLACDVDGTLTDGSMTVHNSEEIKTFSVYDGLGIRLAMSAGLKIAWITGNSSRAVTDRAEALGVRDVYLGSWLKSDAIRDLCERYGLDKDQVAYIGDDLNDLPAFECAGVCFAAANAAPEVLARADLVTQRPGGTGAVREAIETILKAGGRWESAIEAFLAELSTMTQVEPGGPEATG